MAASRRAANAVSKDVQTCFCIISNYVRSLWCINYFFSSSKNRHIQSIAIACLVRRPGNLSEIRKTPYLLRWSTSVLCTCSLKEFCNSRKKTYRVVVLSHRTVLKRPQMKHFRNLEATLFWTFVKRSAIVNQSSNLHFFRPPQEYR